MENEGEEIAEKISELLRELSEMFKLNSEVLKKHRKLLRIKFEQNEEFREKIKKRSLPVMRYLNENFSLFQVTGRLSHRSQVNENSVQQGWESVNVSPRLQRDEVVDTSRLKLRNILHQQSIANENYFSLINKTEDINASVRNQQYDSVRKEIAEVKQRQKIIIQKISERQIRQ